MEITESVAILGMEFMQNLLSELKARRILALNIPSGIMLNCYPGALGQIVVNLVNNALLHAFNGCLYRDNQLLTRQ